MEHKEFVNINETADIAILFIHGIVGTPNHFNEFVALVPPRFSVYNLLLDGHGKKARDFAKSSMKKWESQVESTINLLLKTHKEIYIVAHSMGTLFAIEQAVKNDKITKLFLLASPLKIALKPVAFKTSIKVHFNKHNLNDAMTQAALKCYSIAPVKNPFIYLTWTPRMLELFKKSKETRETLKKLNTNCKVYQSANDELVSSKSIEFLKQNPKILIKELKNSYHYYYDENDFEFLLKEFENTINIEKEVNRL